MNNNFCKYILQHNGTVKQLDLPREMSEGLGMCNPSVFIDKDGKLLCNIRRVNYLFHLSLSNYWNSAYGPTNYHHPDKDVNLRTENYMCELDSNLDIIPDSIKHVEYQKYESKWNFVGEEDVRIVRWNDKLYLTGCRRDTETTGISRMELSEVDDERIELSRTRIPGTGDNTSYCEKNWMPILDKPFHYVKWCNPLEIIEYNPETKETKTVLLKEQDFVSEDELCDLRGSSQVIPVGDMHIAIVHEANLWYNRYKERSAKYYTRFIVWDKDWNVVKLSQRFWFMNFPIEFTNGLAFDGKDFIIPFAVYDNAAYVARLSKEVLFYFIGLTDEEPQRFIKDNGTYNILSDYIFHINSPAYAYQVGIYYFALKQTGPAHAFFLKAAELSAEDPVKYKKIGYDAYYMAQICMESLGERMDKIVHQYNILIQWDPSRYEAYYELSRLYYGANTNLNDHVIAMGFAATAMTKLDNAQNVTSICIDEQYMTERVKTQYAICCYRSFKDYIAVPMLKDLLENGCDTIKEQIKSLGLNLEK